MEPEDRLGMQTSSSDFSSVQPIDSCQRRKKMEQVHHCGSPVPSSLVYLCAAALVLFSCVSLSSSLPLDGRHLASHSQGASSSHRSHVDLLIDPLHQAEFGEDDFENTRVVKSVFDMPLRTPPPPTRCPPGTQSPFEGGPCIKKSTDPVALVDQNFLLDTLRGLHQEGSLFGRPGHKTKGRPGSSSGSRRRNTARPATRTTTTTPEPETTDQVNEASESSTLPTDENTNIAEVQVSELSQVETVTSEGPEDKQTADPVVVEEASDIAAETEASLMVPTEAPVSGGDLRRPVESETVQETGNEEQFVAATSTTLPVTTLSEGTTTASVPEEEKANEPVPSSQVNLTPSEPELIDSQISLDSQDGNLTSSIDAPSTEMSEVTSSPVSLSGDDAQKSESGTDQDMSSTTSSTLTSTSLPESTMSSPSLETIGAENDGMTGVTAEDHSDHADKQTDNASPEIPAQLEEQVTGEASPAPSNQPEMIQDETEDNIQDDEVRPTLPSSVDELGDVSTAASVTDKVPASQVVPGTSVISEEIVQAAEEASAPGPDEGTHKNEQVEQDAGDIQQGDDPGVINQTKDEDGAQDNDTADRLNSEELPSDYLPVEVSLDLNQDAINNETGHEEAQEENLHENEGDLRTPETTLVPPLPTAAPLKVGLRPTETFSQYQFPIVTQSPSQQAVPTGRVRFPTSGEQFTPTAPVKPIFVEDFHIDYPSVQQQRWQVPERFPLSPEYHPGSEESDQHHFRLRNRNRVRDTDTGAPSTSPSSWTPSPQPQHHQTMFFARNLSGDLIPFGFRLTGHDRFNQNSRRIVW